MRSPGLADLFAEICKELETAPFHEVVKRHEAYPENILRWVAELDRAVETPMAVAKLRSWWLEEAASSPSSRTERGLLVAQAIDRWHAPLTPTMNVHQRQSDDHRRAMHRFQARNRLNEDPTYAQVVLKRPFWGRFSYWDEIDQDDETAPGLQLNSLFEHLILLPSQIHATDPDDRTAKRLVHLKYEVLKQSRMRGNIYPNPEERLKVGFAPIAEERDDIQINIFENDGQHWYDVRPAEELGERAARVVRDLCQQGAHIVVLPEMTIHPDALAPLVTAIRVYGTDSQLRLVIAGARQRCSQQECPHNEAILFNHRGEIIGVQRKLHRWNLDADTRKAYKLTNGKLEDSSILFEYITPAAEVTIFEQFWLGRIAIMICEDLSRTEPGRWLRENMLLDWLFNPVLDYSIEHDRWMARFGLGTVLKRRCRFVSVNSLPLTRRRDETRRSAGIGLCMANSHTGSEEAHCQISRIEIDPVVKSWIMVEWAPESWPILRLEGQVLA